VALEGSKCFTSLDAVHSNCEPVLAPHILHHFPLYECGLHGYKIHMLAVFRVLLDGSTCPREAAPARWANCILRENLRQGVRELIAKC
jgi:hypothetical protein